VLDHLMDADSVRAHRALDDPAERVGLAAARLPASGARRRLARSQRRCCPRDLLLAGDESAHVRAMAVELVGLWVHSHPAACSAIERAAAATGLGDQEEA
jgi:hypothetical protein